MDGPMTDLRAEALALCEAVDRYREDRVRAEDGGAWALVIVDAHARALRARLSEATTSETPDHEVRAVAALLAQTWVFGANDRETQGMAAYLVAHGVTTRAALPDRERLARALFAIYHEGSAYPAKSCASCLTHADAILARLAGKEEEGC